MLRPRPACPLHDFCQPCCRDRFLRGALPNSGCTVTSSGGASPPIAAMPASRRPTDPNICLSMPKVRRNHRRERLRLAVQALSRSLQHLQLASQRLSRASLILSPAATDYAPAPEKNWDAAPLFRRKLALLLRHCAASVLERNHPLETRRTTAVILVGLALAVPLLLRRASPEGGGGAPHPPAAWPWRHHLLPLPFLALRPHAVALLVFAVALLVALPRFVAAARRRRPRQLLLRRSWRRRQTGGEASPRSVSSFPLLRFCSFFAFRASSSTRGARGGGGGAVSLARRRRGGARALLPSALLAGQGSSDRGGRPGIFARALTLHLPPAASGSHRHHPRSSAPLAGHA